MGFVICIRRINKYLERKDTRGFERKIMEI